MPLIRPATADDSKAIWSILEPAFRAGDTYTVARDISEGDAIAYWCAPAHEVFLATDGNQVVGTYFLQANQAGGGSHVANCGYITAAEAQGRGVARAMLDHSIARARERGFRAMQFNFVVSTNTRAVRTWEASGFTIVARLPKAFNHPTLGYVDALVMHRVL
ncbi:MAG: GNAT family N-acetyltransferase [Steroidobacteraceae bacterium]